MFSDRSPFSPLVFFVVKCLDFQPRRTRRYSISQIRDNQENSNRNSALEFDETDPCEQDFDHDGLADGKEGANRNGARHPGEPAPLDDDGVSDGLERKIGTAPLCKDSLPALRIPPPPGDPDAQDASPFRTVSCRDSTVLPVEHLKDTVFFVPAYDRVQPPALPASNDPVALDAQIARQGVVLALTCLHRHVFRRRNMNLKISGSTFDTRRHCELKLSESIIDCPEMYKIRYSNFRGCPIRRFPFSIFYTIEDNEIVVHSVFDNRQDPRKRP